MTPCVDHTKSRHLVRGVLAGLLACSAAVGVGVAAANGPQAEPVARPARSHIGSYGFDTTGMDPSVTPGDDFFAYANGAWDRRTTIPADKEWWGPFIELMDKSQAQIRAIVEGASRDPGSRMGTLYASYLDTRTIDTKGLAPIRPWLARIEGIASPADFAAVTAEAKRMGVPGIVDATVSQDARQPSIYALHVTQAGLGMPSRDYYIGDAPQFAQVRDKYRAHVAKVLTLAGEKDADARAAALLAFETGIAKVSWPLMDVYNFEKTYNRTTVPALAKAVPGFRLDAYLSGLGVSRLPFIVDDTPSAFAGIAALAGATPLRTLKDQLIVRSIDTYADVLPKAFADERFTFQGTALTGVAQQPARWQRAVDYVGDALPDDVGKVFVQRHFTPAAKASAEAMVRDIVAAFDRRIDALDWMTPATKVKAHAKVAALSSRVGYPDRWRDYAAIRVAADDAFGNVRRVAAWKHADMIGRIGQPVRRWEWRIPATQVNAVADFGLVGITVPAAILQPPFFDPAADPAINYGGIGAVIAHELSHNFDDNGAKFDRTGSMTEWWTPADRAAFKTRTDALAAQYDRYVVLDGAHLNGRQTLGENIADLGGLATAYDAYRASLGGRPAPVLDGTSGDQRFFLGWAQVWRLKLREETARRALSIDSHSPPVQRVWMMRNLDPWYAAYAVAPAQHLYLPPERRVRIW